ncbi:MAG: endonuclease/exonuclease/phosphatase family protein [Myxococcales bacterium]|nr:endonuclease/exonuclease/phosphatase family protein [Myxococcales bacterium]
MPMPEPPLLAVAERPILRAISLNLWGEQPPLQRRLELCAEGLRGLEPDVIALQEVRQVEGSVPNTAHALAAALSMHCVFQKTVAWGGGDEGLAILSRFPVIASGHVPLPHPMPELADERIFLWALIDTGAGPAFIGSTHLTYRMTHGIQREDQVLAIDQAARDLIALYKPVVTALMGDFNAAPDTDEMRFLRGLHTLGGRRTFYQDAFLCQDADGDLSHRQPGAGATWARRNPAIHKLRFLEMDRRIDYIYVGQASRDGRGLVQRCRVVLDQPDAEGVFPSDHFAVLADIQRIPLA